MTNTSLCFICYQTPIIFHNDRRNDAGTETELYHILPFMLTIILLILLPTVYSHLTKYTKIPVMFNEHIYASK